MTKILLLLGSSRSNGNTRKVANFVQQKLGADLIDLNDSNIGYYDYEHRNQADDFLPLMEKIAENYEVVIFATPVYWYSMSAVMKTFFDRMSDLLTIRKELGRQLRGKKMGAISCGYDDDTVEGLDMPFRESANYLGMEYLGHVYTWVVADEIAAASTLQLKEFCKKIK
ncbi:MAG: NAD(P)H-dependent oxidoreductase [Saprospiraceae bacterium]|nr:NAD(P)H-dependent oxidoreductase [Saprospiraceae bacterium]MCF8252194.1 NAD(P)H-dependent oxidoreductase [Saprospiraceae bacterium]MCF8281553.1 NAD(P)H-dependent oxidoreductase [Bacteroidales bacterium]MCF8313863.1 NAD(P)H-dependent oxidoreductase [Saprospiraceae bacterium]MCF8442545.1 NAD(P)H-dependent oxidoreductase [Saprospiraceae bacterium]